MCLFESTTNSELNEYFWHYRASAGPGTNVPLGTA